MSRSSNSQLRRVVVKLDIVGSRGLRRDNPNHLRICIDKLHFFLIARDAKVHSLKNQSNIPRCLLYCITDGDNSKAMITSGDSTTKYIKDFSKFTKNTIENVYGPDATWLNDHKRITHHCGVGIGFVNEIEDDMSRNVGIAYELAASAQAIYHNFYHRQGFIYNQSSDFDCLKDMVLYGSYGRACYKTQIRVISRILNYSDKVLWFINKVMLVDCNNALQNHSFIATLDSIGVSINDGIDKLIKAICSSFNQDRYKLCRLYGKKCLKSTEQFLEILYKNGMLCEDEKKELLGIVSSLDNSLDKLKNSDMYISFGAA